MAHIDSISKAVPTIIGKTFMCIKKVILGTLLFTLGGLATDQLRASKSSSHPLSGIQLRNVGPAIISGRISGFAFHPDKNHEF